MSETTDSKTQAAFSIGKAMAVIMGITFAADFLIMAVLAQLGLVHKDFMVFILGAAILSAVIGPPVYMLVLSPLRNLGRRRHDMLAAAMIVDGRMDELTQVLNRQAITIDVVEAIAQSERYNNALALALVDIDHLQKINEEQGRDAGDEVLKTVANALTDALRLPDRIGRYAGEEFLVVLPQTIAEDASTIADRIRNTVSDIGLSGKSGSFNATISIGITAYTPGDDLGGVLTRAEEAIAEAKAQGSNLVIIK